MCWKGEHRDAPSNIGRYPLGWNHGTTKTKNFREIWVLQVVVVGVGHRWWFVSSQLGYNNHVVGIL